MKKKIYALTTTSLLLGVVIISLILQPSCVASDCKVKVAGFQFTPVLDGSEPSFFVKHSFSTDGYNIYDPFGIYTDIWSGDCISVGLGQGAHAVEGEGVAGQLCLSIGEPGVYTLGVEEDSVVFGDCDAMALSNPVDLPVVEIMVVQCNDTNDTNGDNGNDTEPEPPVGNDTIALYWIDPPSVVCTGEKFCFPVGIDIPAATEYTMYIFSCNYFFQHGGGHTFSLCISSQDSPVYVGVYPLPFFFPKMECVKRND